MNNRILSLNDGFSRIKSWGNSFVAKNSIIFILGLVLGLFLLNIYVFSKVGFFDFAIEDCGFFLDAAWRLLQGQKIYVDFTFHTGPIQVYMEVLFFKLFGFGRTAILVHLAFINTLMAGATIAVCWRKVPFLLCVFCALHTLAGFYWIHAYPYYDYTAHFFGLLGVLVLALTAPFEKTKNNGDWVAIFTGVMTALCILTKINIGAAYGVIFAAVFAFSYQPFRKLMILVLSVIVVSAIVILTLPNAFAFLENLTSYNALASGRLMRFILLPVFFKNFFWLPIAVLFFAAIDRFQKWAAPLILCSGVGAVAIFTINTGSYRGWDYLPMMGMYLALSFRILFGIYRSDSASKRRKIVIIMGMVALVLAGSLQLGQLMKNFFDVYSLMKNNSSEPFYRLQNGPFKGWVFSKARGELLDSIIATVQSLPPGENLLVLSEMTMIYPFAKKESYRGIPIQWYVGAGPVPWKVDQTRAYLYDHPAEWILTRRDGGPYPVNKIMAYLNIPFEYLRDNYDYVTDWGSNALFRRRDLK